MAQYGAPLSRRANPVSLEGVSRAFGLYEVGAVAPRSTQQAEAEPEALLEWSFEAKVETITLQGAGWRIVSKDRGRATKTHTERVENPEDSSQYVDVEVIDEMTVRDQFGRVYVLQILRD